MPLGATQKSEEPGNMLQPQASRKALKIYSRLHSPPLPGPPAVRDMLSSLCHPTVPRSEGFQHKLVSPAPSTALLLIEHHSTGINLG